MAQNTELQEAYAKVVLQKLRAETVFRNLFNTRYEGNATAGAVKIPVRDTEVTASAYDIANGVSLSKAATSYVTLVTDNDRAVNELIDHYTAAAVPDGLVAERLDSAAYSLAKDVDDDLVACLIDKATKITSTTALTASTIYGAIIDAIQAAKKAHVKASEMWLAVTNDTYGLLLKSEEFQRATVLGDQAVGNGFVGKIGGVPVYETDNIDDTTKVEFILGNNVYCHYVAEFSEPIAVNDLADGKHIGASAVQGRLVDGYTVSKPATVFAKYHA